MHFPSTLMQLGLCPMWSAVIRQDVALASYGNTGVVEVKVYRELG